MVGPVQCYRIWLGRAETAAAAAAVVAVVAGMGCNSAADFVTVSRSLMILRDVVFGVILRCMVDICNCRKVFWNM